MIAVFSAVLASFGTRRSKVRLANGLVDWGEKPASRCRTAKDWKEIEDWKEFWGRRFATPDQQSIPSGRTLTFKQRIGIGPVLLHQLVVDSKQKEWRGPLPHE